MVTQLNSQVVVKTKNNEILIGLDPETNQEIWQGTGKYGDYLRVDKKYTSINSDNINDTNKISELQVEPINNLKIEQVLQVDTELKVDSDNNLNIVSVNNMDNNPELKVDSDNNTELMEKLANELKLQEIVKQKLYQEENYDNLPVNSNYIQKNSTFKESQTSVIDNLKKNNEKFIFNITKKNHLFLLKLKYKR